MKRVAILQEYVPTYRVPFFLELQRRCLEAGIVVTIHAGSANAEQASRFDSGQDMMTVHQISQREIDLLGRRLTLRRTADAARGADLVIIEQARRNVDAYRLLLPHRFWAARRVALWGHGFDHVASRTRIEIGLTAALTRRADHFFAYTEQGAQHVESLGLEPSRVTVVQNTIDVDAFEADLTSINEEQVDAFREEYGLTNLTFLYIGGLDASKRIDFLLKSAEKVASYHSEFRLLIVGDGALRHLVEERASGSPTIRYAGRLTGVSKALAFEASKALLVPGRVGLVAVESMASGTPILTTDWPNHAPEFAYLTRGDSVLVSPDVLTAYVGLVLRVIADQSILSRAKDALARLAPNFGIDQMAANFHRGIDTALK